MDHDHLVGDVEGNDAFMGHAELAGIGEKDSEVNPEEEVFREHYSGEDPILLGGDGVVNDEEFLIHDQADDLMENDEGVKYVLMMVPVTELLDTSDPGSSIVFFLDPPNLESPSTDRVKELKDSADQTDTVSQVDESTMTPPMNWICSYRCTNGIKCGNKFINAKSWENHMKDRHKEIGHGCTAQNCKIRNHFWSQNSFQRHWDRAGHIGPCPTVPEKYQQARDEWFG